ncbi:ADP-ribosylglycohydrolase family protein [Sinomonas mesophila]|uniref:ADP-ribosylglycohydrolase family protein n=1 Tax=Sinomonas mesophila TaxID=1531955 RepID=UPI000985D99E|nr:ADP-ribosylglycohydrolase family protein [Sinomonas mesophila]
MSTPTAAERIHGCLAGTAVAEAAALDPAGTDAPGPASRPLGAAGQLTLFTADALAEAIEWANDGVHADEAACVWLASLRWLGGQGVPIAPSAPVAQARWLDGQEGVRVPARPLPAWVDSLASGEMGTPARPLGLAHDDAGAAAHTAPFGLVPHIPAAAVAKMSADAAHLTHGAAPAVQAAVAVAATAHYLALGADAATALGSARAQVASLRVPDPDVLSALDGIGGVGVGAGPAAQALGRAASAVLAAESAGRSGEPLDGAFAAGVGLAAGHGSDAAAIAGALLGTLWGPAAVPSAWAERTAGMAAADGVAARLAAVTGA